MGLFDKKFDIKDDFLMRMFSPDKGYYYVKSDGREFHEIGVDKLNRRSLKELKRANISLQEDRELLEKELHQYKISKRFDKLKSLGFSTIGFEYLGPVNGSISPMLRDELEQLVSEENVLVGIHRTKHDTSVEAISDILNNGLRIDGHMGGMVASEKKLSDTVSYYPDNSTVIKEAMYANVYKNSSGSIIIRIPDEDLADTSKIYISDGNDVKVNPKYILGYIPVTADHHIDRMYTKSDIAELGRQIDKPTQK